MDQKIISNITPRITNILNGFVRLGLIDSVDKRIININLFESRIVVPEDMVSARLRIGYLTDREKAVRECQFEYPNEEPSEYLPDDELVIEGELDELFSKVYEFLKND